MTRIPDTTTHEITLRPVTDSDREFLVHLYASTREEELSLVDWGPGQRDAFIRMQFDAQDTDYRRNNPVGSFDVIEVGGRPAGRLYVDRGPTDIRVVDISLEPGSRGAGVGGRLLFRLIDEARASDRTVSVYVELDNRAATLYARLGFVVVAELGYHRRMQWAAP
jgi:ribosomal protein S18 acetylase RimI-like enzyme